MEKELDLDPQQQQWGSVTPTTSASNVSASASAEEERIRNEEQNEASFQDAVAVSSALVGESVVDSPQQAGRERNLYNSVSRFSVMQNLGMPSLDANLGMEAATHRSTRSSSCAPSFFPPPLPPLTTDNANTLSVGIMAQGLSWARRQRDRRKRLYLQHQAEQQILKIRAAEEAEQREKAAATRPSSSLMDNLTFQNLLPSYFATYSSSQQTHTDDISIAANVSDPDQQPADGGNDQDDFTTAASISKSGDGISMVMPRYAAALMTRQEQEEDEAFIPPVRVQDDDDDENNNNCPIHHHPHHHSYLLTPEQMHQVAALVLPRGIAYCRWRRLYSLSRDGDAFEAALARLQDHKQTLLVIKTTRNAVFGGYADSAWEPHWHGGASYYGSAKACLFKVITTMNTSGDDDVVANGPHRNDSEGEDTKSQGTSCCQIKAYHWSGVNRYLQLCDPHHKMLAFGGGGNDGAFGLCVEENFQMGSTGHCATFENEPLCDQENFEIVDMEVYSFLVGQF
jgi:hypothetical protein